MTGVIDTLVPESAAIFWCFSGQGMFNGWDPPHLCSFSKEMDFPTCTLILMAFINVVRGAIHAFAPDGGAHSIAGLELTSQNRQTVLALFAAIGLKQILEGAFQIYVLTLRPDLIGLALMLQTCETLAGVFNLHCHRTFPVRVPGATFNLILSFVQIAACSLSFAWEKGLA